MVQVFSALQSGTEEQLEASMEDGAYTSKQAIFLKEQVDLAVEHLGSIGHSRRCMG